jgi:hypothetical protein
VPRFKVTGCVELTQDEIDQAVANGDDPDHPFSALSPDWLMQMQDGEMEPVVERIAGLTAEDVLVLKAIIDAQLFVSSGATAPEIDLRRVATGILKRSFNPDEME